jgi:hypothetical protein
MKHLLLASLTFCALFAVAQESAQPQSAAQAAQTQIQTRSCLAVKPIGSHAFRNIMLAGVAGALISKQQYQVVDATNYPARVGQKFHGNDLQTIGSTGTKVVILDKHYTVGDLHEACGNGGRDTTAALR